MEKNRLRKIVSFTLGICFLILLICITLPIFPKIYGQSTEGELLQRIQQLQNQINEAHKQEKTLSNQLDYIDNQTKLTELKIQNAEYEINKLNQEITDLSGRIDRLSTTLDHMTDVLLNRIITTYKYSHISPIDLIFSAHSFSDLLERIKYIQIIQTNDKKVLYELQATKLSYSDQKSSKETREAQQAKLKKDLENYQVQLASQRKAKQNLLAETKGNEVTYQKLLAQAKAELASLARFATSRGGSLLPHTDLSDSWGKYYNQRDSLWGKVLIGYSSMQVWEVGCLLTSFAMVSSHYGGSITPLGVASNVDNFSVGTAYFKIPGPAANGHAAQFEANPTVQYLQDLVRSGVPVIAGLSNNGGPYPEHYSDHWVVLRGLASDGSFIINDPWYPAAMEVSINNHYRGWTIIEARIYR